MLRGVLLRTALVLALAGCGGGGESVTGPRPATTGASTPAAEPKEALLASRSDGVKSQIFWANPLTLEPVDATFATIPFFHGSAEFSPDGDLLAVGGSERGIIQLVDLDEMRTLEAIDLGAGDWVERLSWVRPDLLLATVGGLPSRVVAVDPTSGEIVAKEVLDGTTLMSVAAGDALVILLAPNEAIGPARVARFDGSELTSVEVSEIRAGYASEGETEEDFRTRQQIPGFAVDPDGARALVVPAGSRVAEVDLAAMEVVYHDLSQPVSLLGRLRDWLEPAAHAKLIEGPGRSAVWLPNGLVAVSGIDYSTDGDTIEADPAGLLLVDPSDWSVHRVSDMPGWTTFRDGALLGSGWEEGVDRQMLEVYDEDGSLRFSLEREGTDLSQTNAGYLYATSHDGTRFEIIDLDTGETVAEAQPTRETYLLYLD
jgi:hypothetical protein